MFLVIKHPRVMAGLKCPPEDGLARAVNAAVTIPITTAILKYWMINLGPLDLVAKMKFDCASNAVVAIKVIMVVPKNS